MKFRALQKDDMPEILKWRSQCPEALRTPYDLTLEQQENWYYDVVCNRQANARWWGIQLNNALVGYAGIEHIEFENGIGEISLLLNPEYQRKGLGEDALDLLLDKGFNFLNLQNLYGECFICNNASFFWHKMIYKYSGYLTTIPNRKYYQGEYWDSMYFSFNWEEYDLCPK